MIETDGPRNDIRKVTMMAALSLFRFQKFYGLEIHQDIRDILKNFRLKKE